MKTPNSATGNEHGSLIGHEDWLAVLEPALCQDTAAVECLARLLFTIRKGIENGPKGVEEARSVLLAGIETAYLYTEAHKAAQRLYLLSLTGRLKPEDEPLRLINGAITRSNIEDAPQKKRSASKKKAR